MNFNKAYEIDAHCRYGGVGITLFPHQLAFGVNIRYWPCIDAIAFRIYIGPLKLWGYAKTVVTEEVVRYKVDS